MMVVVSCDIYPDVEETQPADPFDTVPEVNTTIAQLKALYTKPGTPVLITDDLVIGGQVISSDASGNVYRSFYIQDDTGAIEIKIGKSSLYNDYKLGQWVYIKCKGLALGQYGGMLQIGYRTDQPAWIDASPAYETNYMDVQYLIDAHIFRGKVDKPVPPMLISEAGIKDEANFGRYVRIEGLTYGNKIFVILYDKADNSTYLRDSAYGVTSWAMTQNGFKAYMTPNGKVEPQSAFEGAVTKETWQGLYDAAAAYTVSQYFVKGKTDLQVRTSGYAKFADTKIDPRILKGAVVNLTGILTYYNGNNQFTLIDLDGVEIVQ
jgi:hypothetical protein